MQSLKLGISILVLAGLCTTLSAKVVSLKNTGNADPIKLVSQVSPDKVPDYDGELHKWAEKINREQRKEFYRIAGMIVDNIDKRMDELSAWQSKLEFSK
ncbi:hypothetical protein NHP190003_04300 [Helicobacter sp. NHP19-003]|uniref:Periplasmic protein n=1 Tax=Helicobacter gastrocanis TaxID=2849641 RepID=A0ABM7SGC7_9HELI|nr:DUF1104 domain-containing protein [Helicobacter sp. NHP19-003]BCZ17148.1 hypothetical protein NHP190003_04300 [Helicobacter sp. NHP19-003]